MHKAHMRERLGEVEEVVHVRTGVLRKGMFALRGIKGEEGARGGSAKLNHTGGRGGQALDGIGRIDEGGRIRPTLLQVRDQVGRCGEAAVAGKDEVVDASLPLLGMDGKGTGEVSAKVTRVGGTRCHHAAAPVLPERGLKAPQGVPQPPVVLRVQEAGELEHTGAVEGRRLNDEGADEGIPQALLARPPRGPL